MSVDEARLLEFLAERSRTQQPLMGAVYDGLAARVRRGEFEEKEGDQ